MNTFELNQRDLRQLIQVYLHQTNGQQHRQETNITNNTNQQQFQYQQNEQQQHQEENQNSMIQNISNQFEQINNGQYRIHGYENGNHVAIPIPLNLMRQMQNRALFRNNIHQPNIQLQNQLNALREQQQLPNNNIQFEQNIHPNLRPQILIPSYKSYIEQCVFLVAVLELLYSQKLLFIHMIWMIWYLMLGYWRYNLSFPRVRIWGEFFNLLIWIMTNFYVFGSNKESQTVLPIIILLINIDYYCIGSALLLTFCCFFSYYIFQCIANIRLRLIHKKLQQKKKLLIENLLQKYRLNQNNSEHIEKDNLGELLPSSTKEFSTNASEQESSCSICLQSFKYSNKMNGNLISNQDNAIIKLDCGHRYHSTCIKSWIEQDNLNCPLCRRQIH